jgi:hemolysin activation/secretion protein
VASLGTLCAQAQPVEDPRSVATQEQRALSRERALQQIVQPPADQIGPADPVARQKTWPAGESPCFTIRSIRLVGDAAESFQWALQGVRAGESPAVGRCLGAAGIQFALDRVQSEIAARGFVTTRVLAGPQDLSIGDLQLTLLPGRVRAVRIADASDARATLFNAVPLQPGDLLNLRDLEQALENFKRVPTAQAEFKIEPADTPGLSDVVIHWKQAFPFRAAFTLDDSGSSATGKYQASATISYDHWWTLNDLFYMTLSRDAGGGDPGERGTGGYTAHYSVPWGHWLLGATAGRNRYRQSVAGATQTYLYRGQSETAELKLSRVVYRSASGKATLGLKGWLRRSANFIDDTEVVAQRRATGGWELSAGHRQYLGQALLDVSATYRRGTAAFHSTPAPEEPFGEGTSRMRLVQADASLQLPFKIAETALRYSGTWRAQWNRTPLTPQDRFGIGGRYTVRGFDGESNLSAERGWFVRNDIALPIDPCGCEAYFGADYGSVSGPSARFLAGRHLAGAVVGVRGAWRQLNYDIFVGRPISRPASFTTASPVAGFSLHASF